MRIASNYLARQKEGVQGLRDQRKVGCIGTPTSGADAPTGLFQSGTLDARNRRNHGRWYEVPLYRKSRGG